MASGRPIPGRNTCKNTPLCTADASAPSSFGAGSSAVTVNIPAPWSRIAPGTTGTITLEARRMIDGAGDYTITGTSSSGITVAGMSGRFADNGSARVPVAITVAQSASEGY